MNFHFATDDDLNLLARWNRELIQDEGHRNHMGIPELRERMRGWLDEHLYQAVIFMGDSDAVAYALYSETNDEVYLRQFFVRRDRRRRGIGRYAIEILRTQIWPTDKRLTIDVLVRNTPGAAFWRAMGFSDYCVTMEIMPGQ